jgi:hypothetical protein
MRQIAAFCVIVAALSTLIAVPAAAGAGCVTRREFHRVDVGMRQARVRAIFDTSGRAIHRGPHREEYAYDPCSNVGVVFVTYRQNHVLNKAWLIGE